jgi:hypothetical protein
MNSAIRAQPSKPARRARHRLWARKRQSVCQNDGQRCNWSSACRGHVAALTVEAVFADGGNGRDAVNALQGGW